MGPWGGGGWDSPTGASPGDQPPIAPQPVGMGTGPHTAPHLPRVPPSTGPPMGDRIPHHPTAGSHGAKVPQNPWGWGSLHPMPTPSRGMEPHGCTPRPGGKGSPLPHCGTLHPTIGPTPTPLWDPPALLWDPTVGPPAPPQSQPNEQLQGGRGRDKRGTGTNGLPGGHDVSGCGRPLPGDAGGGDSSPAQYVPVQPSMAGTGGPGSALPLTGMDGGDGAGGRGVINGGHRSLSGGGPPHAAITSGRNNERCHSTFHCDGKSLQASPAATTSHESTALL